jgi:hypothetical protein
MALGFVFERVWDAGTMQELSLYGILAWEHAGLIYLIVLVYRPIDELLRESENEVEFDRQTSHEPV